MAGRIACSFHHHRVFMVRSSMVAIVIKMMAKYQTESMTAR